MDSTGEDDLIYLVLCAVLLELSLLLHFRVGTGYETLWAKYFKH